MEHRSRMESIATIVARLAVVVAVAIAVLVIAPTRSHAVALIAPVDGAKLEWMQTRPVVAFDVTQGEKPKWALLATDEAMTKTVRYCRMFGAAWVNGSWHWGCDTWAIGVDGFGQDIIRPIEAEKTYYLQLVYTDADGVEKKTEVRDFTVDAAQELPNINELSDRIFGSVYGDGSGLNTGAAAFANSGLKITSFKPARISKFRFSIGVGFSGNGDLAKSYVKITSKAGTRYIPLKAGATGGAATGNWLLSASERALKKREFTYQAYIKSNKNGAMVRSEMRLLVIKRT